MGFWESEWGFNGVGQKPVGLPEKSMRFTFNGAVTWVVRGSLSHLNEA